MKPMDTRSSLHEDFVRFKTRMGLERFEIGSPFWPVLKKDRFTKELVLKENLP